MSLHDLADNDGVNLTVTGGEKHEVRQHPPQTIAGAQHSDASVIHAVANYFKHQEEWTRSDWTNLSRLSQYTIPKIKPIGISQGATGNLRSVYDDLLNSNLTLLETKLSDWRDRLVAGCVPDIV